MKLDTPTKIWAASATVAAAAIVACAILRAAGLIGAFMLVPVFIGAMTLLVLIAVRLAQARPRLNLTIAAESVVALGIFSLILSLVVALYGVSDFVTELGRRELSAEDLRRISVPFIEGLLAAGIAPFIATLLRHFEASYSAVESGETGITEAAREATGLATELRNATAEVAGLNKELSATKGSFDTAFRGVIAAAGSLSTALETETERLRFALQRVQAETTALSDSSEKARGAVSAFGKEMGALSAATTDARELMDALGKLIESVERYVRPER